MKTKSPWTGVFLALTLTLLAGSIASSQVVSPRNGRKIMLFGGTNHKIYLGCLSCSKFAQDSVTNEFGEHGSKFQTDSILNKFGQYGGKFAPTSPCNEYATDPPVIVDDRGGFYGELTVNKLRPKRIKSEVLIAWLAGVCADE